MAGEFTKDIADVIRRFENANRNLVMATRLIAGDPIRVDMIDDLRPRLEVLFGKFDAMHTLMTDPTFDYSAHREAFVADMDAYASEMSAVADEIMVTLAPLQGLAEA